MEGQLVLLAGVPYAAVQRPLAGQEVPGCEQLVQAAAPVPEVLTAATSRAVAAVLAHRRQPALVQSPKVAAIVHHQLVGGLRQREAAQLEVQRVVDDDGEEGEEAATLEGGQREEVEVVQQKDQQRVVEEELLEVGHLEDGREVERAEHERQENGVLEVLAQAEKGALLGGEAKTQADLLVVIVELDAVQKGHEG